MQLSPPSYIASSSVPSFLRELFSSARALCEPSLRTSVESLAEPLRKVAGYHLGWIDAAGNPTAASPGKFLRPALALLSAEAVGGPAAIGASVGGTAVELVHNFSLLHDDVMDHDRVRRHRWTALAVFGEEQAILAGDALLAKAFGGLQRTAEEAGVASEHASRASQALARSTEQLVDGQAHDMAFETRVRVSVEEYMNMAAGKTGSLFACSSSIGAILCGASADKAEALERFGHHMGLAFQAVDDVLGIWGDQQKLGKVLGGDLRRRKKSLVVAAAMESETAAARELMSLLAKIPDHGEADECLITRCVQLLEIAGGRSRAESEARRQRQLALQALEEVAMPEHVRDRLVNLADFVIGRNH
ncbi:polyprenyl synthetase family protein [Streptomyces chryseus]